MVSRALLPPFRSAAANSRAGNDRWTTSWPCPYRTAGGRPARRVPRGRPLADTRGGVAWGGGALAELGAGLGFEAEVSHGGVLLGRWVCVRAGDRARHTPQGHTHVDHGVRRTVSLAGQHSEGTRFRRGGPGGSPRRGPAEPTQRSCGAGPEA